MASTSTPWDLIDPVINSPTLSATRKAECIYTILREEHHATPPHDFFTSNYWKPYIDDLLLHVQSRSTNAVKRHIVAMAERFADRPRATGKRKSDESEGIDDHASRSGSELEAASRFRLEDVKHSCDIAFIRRMSLSEIADGVLALKRARREPYIAFAEVVSSVQFDDFRRTMRSKLDDMFSRAEFLPQWKSDLKAWESNKEAYDHLLKLRADIPAIAPEGPPDLTLFRVGDGQAHKLDSKLRVRADGVRAAGDIVFVNGPRGSGKSRLLLETATFGWSLLLHFAPPESGREHGSADLESAVRLLSLRSHCVPDTDIVFEGNVLLNPDGTGNLHNERVQDILTDWKNNTSLVEHIILVLIFARMLVLEEFYLAWHRYNSPEPEGDSANSAPPPPSVVTTTDRESPVPANLSDASETTKREITAKEARRMWAILQMRPKLLDDFDDVFLTTMTHVLFVHPKSLKAEISRRLRYWNDIKLVLRRVLVDDAHLMSSRWSDAFGTQTAMASRPTEDVSTATMKSSARGLLSVVLNTLLSHFPSKVKYVFASTGSDSEWIGNLETDLATVTTTIGIHTDLGGQFSDSEFTQLLDRFFGSEFARTLSPSLKREMYYWVPGRHLFSMTFIRSVLCGGPSVMPAAVNTLVGVLTGTYPDADAAPLDDMKQWLRQGPLVPLSRKERLAIIRSTRRITNMEHVLMTWLLHSRKPTGDPEDHQLVNSLFGRFVADAGKQSVIGTRTKISENIAAVSVRKLFQTGDKEHSMVAYVDRGVSSDNPVFKGFSYEDLLVYQLCMGLSRPEGMVLDTWLDFCYLRPSWAGETAQLVGVFRAHTEAGKEPELVPQALLTRLAWSTGTHEETLEWFQLGKSYAMRIPLLKPDKLWGPDIVLVVRLGNGKELLIVVQCKCWSTKHGGKEILEAFYKLSPEGYYSSNKGYHDSIISALTELLKDSKLDMTNGVRFPSNPKVEEYTEKYAQKDPELPILRIFAAFEETVNWPDMTKSRIGSYGRYPLARLSKRFMKETSAKFPSFKAAAESARTLNKG
ncbi:hypothetical protein EXIGLDRAFT_745388 [Exidia glandulosa HHB12029]|uniref:Uncharacterized protein n=1 Tax=Exidia glandulosa HHB12029 TaxID=1314781 RepID=A0A165NP37_EXIGL|nr:hypothetical protein EXIGLDRAFT_745388 [Exidia glandulosa HHB12029]